MLNKYLSMTITITISITLTARTVSPDTININEDKSSYLCIVEPALKVAGFPIQDNMDIQKDNIPYKLLKNYNSSVLLTDNKYEWPIWEIVIKKPQVLLNNWEMDTNFIKDYIIYVEEKSQQTIEIWGICYSYFDSINISINYDSLLLFISDNNMRIVDSVEGYHGIPKIKPIITFIEALNKHIFGSPYLAKLIICKYVLYSCNKSEKKPAWAIHFYGLPSMLAHDGKGFTEWRTVVDAQNGDLLFTSSGPCTSIR